MRKYRLLKDTPALKAGTVFELKDGRLFLKESEDCVAISVFQKDGVNDFDEWFEEVREFGGWQPKGSKKYKYLNSSGKVDVDIFLSISPIDQFRYSTGNCYPLDTPDELIIKE